MKRSAPLFAVLLVLAMIIWGGSWVSAKSISHTMPIEVLTFWRFLINAISFVPVLVCLNVPFRFDLRAAADISVGALALGLYFFLFFKVLGLFPAGAAGVIVTTTMPMATLALSIPLLGQRFRASDTAGLVLGAVGGCILIKVWTLDIRSFAADGTLYLVLCPALWALVTIYSRKAARRVSPLVFSFYCYLACTVAFFFIARPAGIGAVFSQGVVFWLNMLYLGVVSSTFATTVYFVASSRFGAYRASSFAFLVPCSALVLGWLFLGETPEPSTIIGGVIAMAATYVINRGA